MEPLAILAGPTAVGKTALSLPVAEALNAEVLNVDSRQLYRYMDIGTAKPTLAQRSDIPHHLLDMLCPNQLTSAAQFASAARLALDDIQSRGKRVLIVAGSGLYLQALLYGLMPVPPAHDRLRHVLRLHADQAGTADLHRWLQQLDPDAAVSIHPNDSIRLTRALEVIFLTGEAFSEHRRRHQSQMALYPYVAVGLTRQRAELNSRIVERTKAMLAAGWVSEVKSLRKMGYTRSGAALNSLGYRNILDYLEGHCKWEVTVEAIVTATRQLAKRQLTWFRKMPHFDWLELSGLDDTTAIERILSLLQRRLPPPSLFPPSIYPLASLPRQPLSCP